MDPIAAIPLTPSLLGIDTAAMKHGTASAKLRKAAQDFEALMIGEMLKTTRESGSDGWLGSGDSAGNDSAMGLAESQLAQALASGGGLGLARMIEKQLARPSAPNNGDQNKNASSVPPTNSVK
ncbi:MAG: rod-binding protein [Bryobacteraceae bacterium]